MQLPYEYSYFAFDFCLIKKMCVRKQKSERVEGESKETRERERQRHEQEGSGWDQQPGWRVRMSDETNRAVQAPTHTATAVIYGADASGMENRASGEKGPEKIGPAHRHISPALIKRCSRVQSDKTAATSRLLNKDDMFCMEKLHPELGARKSTEITTTKKNYNKQSACPLKLQHTGTLLFYCHE